MVHISSVDCPAPCESLRRQNWTSLSGQGSAFHLALVRPASDEFIGVKPQGLKSYRLAARVVQLSGSQERVIEAVSLQ